MIKVVTVVRRNNNSMISLRETRKVLRHCYKKADRGGSSRLLVCVMKIRTQSHT